jgi:glutamate carboxypeptidase
MQNALDATVRSSFDAGIVHCPPRLPSITRMTTHTRSSWLRIAIALLGANLAGIGVALGAAHEPVRKLVEQEKPAVLETLRELVAFESGSKEFEELERIGAHIAQRLGRLGGRVERVEPADVYRMADTPAKVGRMVQATFTGKGTKKILLIAHMDTVYPRGMLKQQPFRLDGDRAYGLGIADDKHGVALILHALAVLKTMNFADYGTLTVLINADEEISSPGSRSLFTRLGGEHDVVLSFEGAGTRDSLRLATSGTGSALLTVQGRASHSGGSPERGVNALYEMAHQVLQMRDLSDAKSGLKMNWTMARAGLVRNMIPPEASAEADVRVERLDDFEGLEEKLRARIKNKLLPESQVSLVFERRRPPLQPTAASRAVAAHAQSVYAEIGKQLTVADVSTGGGTDAAFAALKTRAPVIEGFGLMGFGAHTTDAEYVVVSSIEPRLYLAVRMIIDLAQGKAPLP